MNWLSDWQLRLIQLLAVPGIIVAYYLFLFHQEQLIIVCSAGGWDDCGAVSGPDAPYSKIGPIPVALIGMMGYATIFMLVWLQDWVSSIEEYLPEIMVAVTGIALLFSLWLTALELFVIHAFCRYCVVSAVIILVMFGLAVSHLRQVTRA